MLLIAFMSMKFLNEDSIFIAGDIVLWVNIFYELTALYCECSMMIVPQHNKNIITQTLKAIEKNQAILNRNALHATLP